ncbi:histone family protein DNA-binding protein [Oleidesulfovibrio alaskensis G20]|jgi:DNA-binding protein HU-beta|uniref:Histone family protein DNA-binding protein n=1 Tax=Oleidesulfovibrio alaskensis (strain ATCC BAA-1058 / DSM 17464 / G20) TaxID=207559 RepID=Q317H0_OLEA2|nr:HU family DNA-binding protein [Oleidesulfovibrio alaskensis]ABB36926.1 histone family protein DNA-binding protein [Oleidesulfovibrio alaskensis G20]MBG0774193.1 HU family DNA-binding protein [Oleidesulfovibrio alaskensis]MBL3583629.1 HU family DNA-binding protein [Oleidesulfovibrio alaskensis]
MLTKAEFVAAFKDALPEVFETKVSAEKAYDAFCQVLADGIAKNEGVRLPNVGALTVAERAERQGRNPQTGQPMTIPARKVVKFSPAKSLVDGVNR